MTVLLPRLPSPAAEKLLDVMLVDGRLVWSSFDPDVLPPETRFAATGGHTISSRELRELREGIESIAGNHGFGRKGAKAQARFDAAMSEFLAGQPFLDGGEALRDDAWTFIAVVLAPDVVHWRFGSARERYLGGVRNTFQRQLMRATALDRGTASDQRWKLVELLTEDALVQLTERPAIGADPVLARQLGEAWVRAAERYGRGSMEPIMRLAILRLRIRNEIRSLAGLPERDLEQVMDGFFAAAAETLRIRETGQHSVPLTDQETDSSSPAEGGTASLRADDSTRRRSWAIWRAR